MKDLLSCGRLYHNVHALSLLAISRQRIPDSQALSLGILL